MRTAMVFACFACAALTVLSTATGAGEAKRTGRDGQVYHLIPAGTFTMGCSPGDAECFDWEQPAHRVTITHPFWIGQTLVTQGAWRRMMGSNPSRYPGANLPVEQVSWDDARRYCETAGMRLPSEAEGEFAARAGTTGAQYGAVDSVAWYDGNAGDRTHPVASKAPNAFGLYDMLGNVWEWVMDSYDTGEKKILRGGSFFNPAREVRVSNRLWALPETAHRDMGVRCVGD